MLKEQVEAEWVDYPTAEKFSGLSHTNLWRRVSSLVDSRSLGRSIREDPPPESLRQFMERGSEEATGQQKKGHPRQAAR